MCTANTEIIKKVQELQELKRMQEELAAEIDTLQDAIKAYMGDEESMTAGAFKVSYKAVTSTRIDTAKLRKDLPEVWTEYGKTTTARRFQVN